MFSIINNDCTIVFKSLKYFKFQCESCVDLKIIKNIYKNIDKIPNINYFHFHCVNPDVEQQFYMELIYKFLKLKLNYSFIEIKTKRAEENIEYSKKELREAFPNLIISKLIEVHIKKLNKEKNKCNIY